MSKIAYLPCEYTIKASALGISPLLFNKKISFDNTLKTLSLSEDTLKDVCKALNLSSSLKCFTTKQFISIIDYAIKTNTIEYDKNNIKERFFRD